MKKLITICTMLMPAMVWAAEPQPAPAEPVADTWLGVELTSVPAALASHLKLDTVKDKEHADDSVGLMVDNIFVDSPADRAGLQRYDVLIGADDRPVSGDIRDFARHVRHRRPGQSLTLTFYHRGEKRHATIELGRRPGDVRTVRLKYVRDPDARFEDNFGLRGKIFKRGPHGWELHDMGPMPELPPELRNRLGQGFDQAYADWLRRYLEGISAVNHARRVDEQGDVLQVRRLDDGRYQVKRYNRERGESAAEIKTYASIDDLEALDPQAYELFRNAEKEAIRNGDIRWQDRMQQFFEGFSETPSQATPPATQPTASAPSAEIRPAVHFHVSPDGTVTVTLRRADGLISRIYPSVEALRRDAPDLYERYETLRQEFR